ncbi:MAG: sugar ABC transporter permease, partial [Candidatus Binatia bacterium]
MKSAGRFAALLSLPSFLFILVFSLYPIVESFHLSFYRLILTLPWLGQKFVGLENYRDLVTDPVALRSLTTTLIFVALTAPLEVALGLG